MNARRATVAGLTVGLHAALGFALAWALRAPERQPTPQAISVQLVPAYASPPSLVERFTAPVPQLAAPNTTALAVPLIALTAPGVEVTVQPEPEPEPATPSSPPARMVATAAPAAPPPAAEPEYQAALPPSHQCTDQTVARHYPPLLRERGVEGRVLLRVRVDELGRAAEVRVTAGSGWRLLDEAAQRLTQDCRFVPAHRGGHALMSWVEYPVSFALN